jgi:hypothetical protein
MLANSLFLMVNPRRGWNQVAAKPPTNLVLTLLFPLCFALLPALAWYVGTTHVGWQIGSDSSPVRMTTQSAQIIAALFYATMVLSIAGIGYLIHWMALTYGAQSTVTKGIGIAALTATPLFVAGAVGFHPSLMVDLLIGVIALCYAVYLLYIGIPIVMQIPQERGFLFSSAVIAVCMVIFISILGASVILWDSVAPPIFRD